MVHDSRRLFIALHPRWLLERWIWNFIGKWEFSAFHLADTSMHVFFRSKADVNDTVMIRLEQMSSMIWNNVEIVAH